MLHKSRMSHVLLLFLVVVLTAAWGCQKKGEEVPLNNKSKVEDEVAKMPPIPSKIAVPDDVKEKWQAVVFEVTDKDTNEKTDYTVNIGDTAPLGNTGLNIYVEAFLPSFKMRGDVFTSDSNDPNNPAAKVKITDASGKELYNRWLFSLYPATHPFEHEKYAVVLKSYVAKEK